MTPAQRYFPNVVRFVAEAYELSVDDLTAEDRFLSEAVREARRVVCGVATRTIGLSSRQIGRLLQRDQKAICWGIRKLKRDSAKNPMLRKTLTEIEQRVKEDLSRFAVLQHAAE